MDDMMSMSFDQLRGEVAPAAQTVINPGMTMQQLGGGSRGGGSAFGGPSALMGPAGGSMRMLGGPMRSQIVEIPDHRQELDVCFFGPGADKAAARGPGMHEVDARFATAACEGKRDFILFEPLDDAAKENRRLVLVLPMGAGSKGVKQAQVYLASSLASWLNEQKTDGSGRPYGECKDEDPTLRKHFTRAQIVAIREFGAADSVRK